MKLNSISVASSFHLIILLLIIIFASRSLAQNPPIPDGRRLREIVDDKYSDGSIIIGGTTGAWAFGTNTGILLDREFSYVTPENDFKQWNIHPDNSSYWNWVEPDAWINHTVSNGQILRIHGPIGPQCSEWAQEDSRTPTELEQNMIDFFTALCQHYNGTANFEYMDVVNETVINGEWHKDKPGLGWECPWYKIGVDNDANNTPLYIRKAFEIAQLNAPDKKFIYNHHEYPIVTDSWNLIKETVLYLRNLGLRVDGIGWQGHVENGWANQGQLDALRDLIDWAHNNDLEFHITEASVWLLAGISQQQLELQAETYNAILDVLLEKRSSGKVGWNTWHIDDGSGWHNELYPSLFDSAYTAKPAYYWIQDALENAPAGLTESTNELPDGFKLFNNYPNPFNPSTKIKFSIPQSDYVRLEVFNSLGENVSVLVSKELTAGIYNYNWNASNLTSGIYFYKLQAGNFVETKKMILIK